MKSSHWFIIVALTLFLAARAGQAQETANLADTAPPPSQNDQQQVIIPPPPSRAPSVRPALGGSPPRFQRGTPQEGPGGKPTATPLTDEQRSSWRRLVLRRVNGATCQVPGVKPGDDDDAPDDLPSRGRRMAFDDAPDGPPGRPGQGPGSTDPELRGVPAELANDPDFLDDVESAKQRHQKQCEKRQMEEARDEMIDKIHSMPCPEPDDSSGHSGGPGFASDMKFGSPDRNSDDDDSKGGFAMKMPPGIKLDSESRDEINEATDRKMKKCMADRPRQPAPQADAFAMAGPNGAGGMGGPGGMGGSMFTMGGGNSMTAAMQQQMLMSYRAPYLYVGGSGGSVGFPYQQQTATPYAYGYSNPNTYYISSLASPFAQTSGSIFGGQNLYNFQSLIWGRGTYGGTSSSVF